MRFRTQRALSALFIASAGLSLYAFSASAELCPSPRPNLPTLTFSLPSFQAGGLDQDCQKSLTLAKTLGFTGVALSPSFFIDFTTVQFSIAPQPGEITRCLDQAWELGFEILYKPHLENDSEKNRRIRADAEKVWKNPNTSPTDIVKKESELHEESDWRAMMAYLPDSRFDLAVLSEFNQWASAHAQEIEHSPRKVDVTLTTELQGSIMIFPGHWKETLIREKQALSRISKKIQVGIDPSVFKPDNPNRIPFLHVLKTHCNDYRALLSAADFFAPSSYGNLDDASSPRAAHLIQSIVRDQTLKTYLIDDAGKRSPVCELDTALQDKISQTLNFGEFGYGGDLSRTWVSARLRMLAPETRARARKDAAFAMKDFIFSLKSMSKNTENSARWANLWNTGAFDLWGFSSSPSLSQADSEFQEISKLFREYTQARCQ